MQLDIARDLKRQIHATMASAVRVRGEPGMAVGVAPGDRTGDYRIAVRARSKDEVSSDVLKEIHDRACGEVDLRFTGPIRTEPATDRMPERPLAIGASVAHFRASAGSLGFFARRISDGAVGFVSNNHVLACEDRGREGDDILHPGPADKGKRTLNVVARLDGSYPKLKQDAPRVDCAFARLLNGIRDDPTLLAPGERLSPAIAFPADLADVSKIARTSGRTWGRITAFDLDGVDVRYSFGSVAFNDQIEIESRDVTPFSNAGDNGSLVFTRDRQPLGLVYARSMSGLTYASSINAVLAALGVELLW